MVNSEYYFKYFKKLLLEENEHHNLISRKSTEDDIARHIEDSMEVMKHVSFQRKKIIDIGTGAGFPGLILAMGSQEGIFTLVEADLKKSQFLERIKKELALNNVVIVRNRIEEIGQDNDHRASFDYCTIRAVASINVLIEYGLPLLKLGGELLLWKGKKYQEEVQLAGRAMKILGASVKDIYHYNKGEYDRVIVVLKKNNPTPEKYPRRVGIPSKRPL